MSRIEFTRIFGKNYGSYESFEFPVRPGKHLICGPNGAGKSTAFESLDWTIYKNHSRGSDPSRHGKGNCETGVDFRVGDDEYTAIRYHKHSEFKNTARLSVNGGDVSDRIASAVDDQIQKVVGIKRDLFATTCVVMQGLPVNFAALTPAVRKQVLEDSLGFGVWDEYKKKVSKAHDGIEDEIDVEVSKRNEIKEELTAKTARLEAIRESQEKANDSVALSLDEQKKACEELKATATRAEQKYEKFAKSIGGQEAFEEKLEDTRSKLSRAKRKIEEQESIIKTGDCPTCNRPYPKSQIEDAKAALKDAKELVKSLTKLYEELQESESALDDLMDLKRRANAEHSAASSQYKRALAEAAESKRDQSGEVKALAKEVKELVAAEAEICKKLEDLDAQRDRLNYLNSLLVPSSRFRTEVLVNYMDRMSKFIDRAMPYVFPHLHAKLEVSKRAVGVDVVIERDGRQIEYKSLSGGERRRLDLVLIVAFQRFLIEVSGVSTNMIVFDEVFDGLDAQGVDSFISCLDALFPESMAIYVVSHNQNLKSRFDSVIRVSKDSGSSRMAESSGY